MAFLSLPFVLQPILNAFEAISERHIESVATLRASPRDTFFTVVMPLTKPGYLTAMVMGFAHTLGEFGAVLMIGGNIPDKTRVVSVQIYDHVDALEYAQAHSLAAGMQARKQEILPYLEQLHDARDVSPALNRLNHTSILNQLEG